MSGEINIYYMNSKMYNQSVNPIVVPCSFLIKQFAFFCVSTYVTYACISDMTHAWVTYLNIYATLHGVNARSIKNDGTLRASDINTDDICVESATNYRYTERNGSLNLLWINLRKWFLRRATFLNFQELFLCCNGYDSYGKEAVLWN